MPHGGQYDYLQLKAWDLLEKFLITNGNYSAILANPTRLAEHNINKIYLRDRNLPIEIFRAFLKLKNVEIFVNRSDSPEILAHKNIHLKSDELHLAGELKNMDCYDLPLASLAMTDSGAKSLDSANRAKNLDSALDSANFAESYSQNLPKILSYSAHSLDDILNAHKAKIDYIFISPIFAAENKNSPLGIDFIKQIPREIKPKIFALGGINANNIKAFENLGIAGIAGIRIFSALFNK